MDFPNKPLRVMVFGVGGFSQCVLHILKEHGAEVSAYLTRAKGRYGPSQEAETYSADVHPNPCPLLKQLEIDFVVPMSIDWVLADWTDEFLALGIPILSPSGDGMNLERDRNFARKLCERFNVPFPKAFVARNRLEAERLLEANPGTYVIKNTLCSPQSPVHTIVCESPEDTGRWLGRINYAEGVFLQQFMGHREAGHIAFVTGGEIYPLVSNQEYKRAYDGNMGIVAGAPLGGLVEKDPEDKYHLAKELLYPLLPWFREVGFCGPVQVTAIRENNKWFVLEYNVRIGVTCGPIILRMLQEPLTVLWDVVRNKKTEVRLEPNLNYGCSLTLAGYGYPFGEVSGPRLPVELSDEFDSDVWWNEVALDANGRLSTAGQRIADVVATGPTLEEAIDTAYVNIRKIRCLSSYYRTDIGRSRWPPGSD